MTKSEMSIAVMNALAPPCAKCGKRKNVGKLSRWCEACRVEDREGYKVAFDNELNRLNNEHGRIVRSQDAKRAFMLATGYPTGTTIY